MSNFRWWKVILVFQVDIIYSGEVLPQHFSLMDVAYTFKWSRVRIFVYYNTTVCVVCDNSARFRRGRDDYLAKPRQNILNRKLFLDVPAVRERPCLFTRTHRNRHIIISAPLLCIPVSLSRAIAITARVFAPAGHNSFLADNGDSTLHQVVIN